MKIESLHHLRKEKRKLKLECKEYEQKIATQFDALQENAGTIVIDTVIRAIPKINIIGIISNIFTQWVGKKAGGSRKSSEGFFGSGLMATLIPMGITMALKFFKRAGKK